MSHLITCPSGLELQCRSMGGAEIIAIAERQKGSAAATDSITTVLHGCLEVVTDPGPYPFVVAGPTKPPWPRMNWSDVLVAILRLRTFSFPRLKGDYEFDFACQYEGCGKLSPWNVNIDTLLASSLYRPLSEDGRKRVRASSPFEHVLTSSGQTVYFQLGKAELDKPMKDLIKRESRTKETDVELVAKQLVRVDGLVSTKTSQPVTELLGLWRWAKGLSFDDIDELLEAYGKQDGGIDTELRVHCEHCGKEQDIALPFGRTFFRPRTATKKAETDKDDSGEDSAQE